MSDLDKTIIKPRPGQGRETTGDDSTVIRPRPAGSNNDDHTATIFPKRKTQGSMSFNNDDPDRTQVSRRNDSGNIQATSIYDLPGLPELIRDASPLLSIISQVKQLDGSIQVEKLRQHISNLMSEFIRNAGRKNDNDLVKRASYALCATIDEAVLNTPWGQNSAWSQKPLLSIFHHETYGGEKFYAMLDNETNGHVKRYELIELLYMCLSLGFLGKLRVEKNGQITAEKIRANTYQVLSRNRNRFTRIISTNITPVTTEKSKLTSFLPIWILALALALCAFFIYKHWLLDINKESDVVVNELASLIPIKQDKPLDPDLTRKEIILLRQLLQQEIEVGVLTVNDYQNRSSVVLRSSELFESGSADMNDAFKPILDKIAKALEAIPGKIIVSGHTDNIDIRTARFPSNWHLSLARATTVDKYMSQAADLKGRSLPEGRGATEPVADNSTPEGRAQNRRVMIELFYDESGPLINRTRSEQSSNNNSDTTQ